MEGRRIIADMTSVETSSWRFTRSDNEIGATLTWSSTIFRA